jgi:hypothetical protein
LLGQAALCFACELPERCALSPQASAHGAAGYQPQARYPLCFAALAGYHGSEIVAKLVAQRGGLNRLEPSDAGLYALANTRLRTCNPLHQERRRKH